MALAPTAFELRSTGNDNNGGGFTIGGSGTDRSQQATAQVSIDNSSITTSITTNVITFTGGTYTPSAADVDNIVHMISGTNVITQYFRIVSVGATTWTMDRNVVSAGTATDGIGNMGGCLLTFGQLGNAMQQGSLESNAYIKAATYTSTSTSANASNGTVSTGGSRQSWYGYQNTRGDNGTKPLITTTQNSTIFVQTGTGVGLIWDNLEFDGANKTTTGAFQFIKSGWRIIRCKFSNFTNPAITNDSNGVSLLVDRCEVTGCSSGNGAIFPGTSTAISRCYIHDNSTSAIIMQNGATNITVWWCILDSNNGNGIIGSGNGFILIENCSIYGNSGDGINITVVTAYDPVRIYNTIFEAQTGVGKYGVTASVNTSGVSLVNCAFFNNTGNTNNIRAQDIEGTILPTASPFTNAGAGDFSLNALAGAGLVCRQAGLPGVYPGGLSTSYLDVGAVQSAVAVTPPAPTASGNTYVGTWSS